MARTHRVAIDAACANLQAPAPFNGVIDTNDERAPCGKRGDQQPQQDLSERKTRPDRTTEHTMIFQKTCFAVQTNNAQTGGDGASVGG